MNTKTKQISEGAMMIALVSIVLLLNRQTANFLEDFLFWLMSIPMLIYSAKYGMKMSVIVFVSSLLVGIMFAAPTTMFYLGAALITGIAYGYGVRHNWNNRMLLSVSIIMELLSMLLVVVVLASIFGYNLLDEFSDVFALIESSGLVINSKSITVTFLAILYAGTSVLQGILLHVLAHLILTRIRISIQPLKPLQDIYYPKWVAYVIMAIWIFYLLGNFGFFPESIAAYVYLGYTVAFMIGMSAGVITLITYAVQKKNKLFVFLAIMACFIPFLNNLIFCLGVYDIYADMRHNKKVGE